MTGDQTPTVILTVDPHLTTAMKITSYWDLTTLLALNLNVMFYICFTPPPPSISIQVLEHSSQMMIFPHEGAGVPEHVGVSSSGDSVQQTAASMWRRGGGGQRKLCHLQSAASTAALEMRWCCAALTAFVCIRCMALFAPLGASFLSLCSVWWDTAADWDLSVLL